MRTILFTLCVLYCASLVCARYDWYLQRPSNVSAAQPLPRYHHGASAVGNHTDAIVVVGGFDFIGSGVFLNDTWVFHTRNNTWRFVNSSLVTNFTNRAYFTAVPYRYEVIAFGGQGPNGPLNDTWRFRNWTWQQDTYHPNSSMLAKNYLSREYHASAIVGDVMYVFGGHSAYYGVTSTELFAYNLTNNNWTRLSDIYNANGPQGRQGHTLDAWRDPVLGDSLILFGGYSDRPYSSGFNDAWQYVIKDNKWYQFNNVGAPAGRSGHAGAILGNVLYIQGGYSIQNIDKPPTYDVYYGDTWALTLNGGGASKWAQVTDDIAFGINRRQGHDIVTVNSTLYSVGGYVQYVGLDANVYAFVDVKSKKHRRDRDR